MNYVAINGLAASASVADRGEHGVSICVEQIAAAEVLVREGHALRLQFRNCSDRSYPNNSV